MRIDVVTLFPDMVQSFGQVGIVRIAQEKGLLQLVCWNPRDYTEDNYQTVDDRPYGGGPGMVMKVEPLRKSVIAAKKQAVDETGKNSKVVYLTPQGKRLDQQKVQELAGQNLVLIAGRYEGIDERLVEMEVDEELSVGDYVLSGGEPAAMVVVDAVTRLQPGALGDEDSAQQDSFMNGLLDYPHYTRPERLDDIAVPEVLLSGNHKEIDRWRNKQALGRTWLRRPDLLKEKRLDAEQQALLDEFIKEYENRNI